MITLIVAIDQDRVIGYKGKIPWHLKDDLRHFREKTLGKTVIMGQTTYESLKGPLPERINIVGSFEEDYQARHPKIQVVRDLEPFLIKCSKENKEYMVIGGASVYKLALPYASKIILSLVEGKHKGDTYFPEFEADFKLMASEQKEGFVVKYYVRRQTNVEVF